MDLLKKKKIEPTNRRKIFAKAQISLILGVSAEIITMKTPWNKTKKYLGTKNLILTGIIFFGVFVFGSFIISICFTSGVIENEKINLYINSFKIGTTVLLILLLLFSRIRHIKERNEKALTKNWKEDPR
jgi:uncharacterized membrane protein YbhN (UPF0104 family)